MHLIVGATGMVGGEICRLLTAAGRPVRAVVRSAADPAKVQRLRQLGVEIVAGDLRERRSLRAACRGAEAVLSTASAMPFAYQAGTNTPQTTDQEGVLHLIAAARQAGAGQFVCLSFPPMAVAFPLQDAKRAVEQRLAVDGLTYTVLQPTFFAEVWLSPAVGFDHPNRKATIYGTGANPISWISYRDVAQFAVACLGHPAARNAVLPLGGPEALSPLQAVALFAQAGGRPFAVTHVPVEALQGQYAGATDPMQKSFSGLMLSYAAGQAIDMTATLKAFPLKLRTVAEYAASVMK